MRVAHFCDSEPSRIDGVSASVDRSVALLRAAGHQVSHYFPGPASRGGMRSVPVPFRLIRVAMPWVRADPADTPDVVHVHTTGPVGLAGFRLAAERAVPLVLTWHTDLLAYAEHFPEIPLGAANCAARLRLGWTIREYLELTDLGGRRRSRLLKLGHALFARTSLVIAPSEKTAAGLAVFGALPPVWTLPTPVIPHVGGANRDDLRAAPPVGGIDRDDLRAALDLPPGAPVVLSVGRVTPEKNPALLLRAFARLVARRPDARLVVVGVRQGRRPVRALVRDLGLTDRVRLVPPVPRERVGGYYRMADVLAFASTTDTQSLVVAEAEAAGLPVVVADAGLSRRAGGPPSPRMTSDPDPESLAAALLRLLDDGDLRERISRAALQAARAYSPELYLARLTAAYDHARRTAASNPAAGRRGPA